MTEIVKETWNTPRKPIPVFKVDPILVLIKLILNM